MPDLDQPARPAPPKLTRLDRDRTAVGILLWQRNVPKPLIAEVLGVTSAVQVDRCLRGLPAMPLPSPARLP